MMGAGKYKYLIKTTCPQDSEFDPKWRLVEQPIEVGMWLEPIDYNRSKLVRKDRGFYDRVEVCEEVSVREISFLQEVGVLYRKLEHNFWTVERRY